MSPPALNHQHPLACTPDRSFIILHRQESMGALAVAGTTGTDSFTDLQSLLLFDPIGVLTAGHLWVCLGPSGLVHIIDWLDDSMPNTHCLQIIP